MNSSPKILVAAAVALLLNSASANADPVQFNVPSTVQAQQSAELLRRTADGFYKLPLVGGNRTDGQGISDLWLFPTGDLQTVFARYTVDANDRGQSPNQHLAVLTVRDNQIVAVRELTDARLELTRNEGRTSDGLHWSAAIGTGHAADSTVASSAAGSPASADWTASIGTGRAALPRGVSQITPEVSSVGTASTAQAHWSSKIGSGRASEAEVGHANAPQGVTIAALNGVQR